MGAIASTDVTITLKPQDIGQAMGRYWTFPTIAFGNGSLTYPTNGVPLPAKGALGPFKKEIQRFIIDAPPGNGYIYKYDRTNHTIRIYQSAAAGSLTVVAASAGTPTGSVAAPVVTITDGTTGNAVTFNSNHLEATGGGTFAAGAPVFTGTAMDTHSHDITGEAAAGALTELGAVIVPTSTLYATIIGK